MKAVITLHRKNKDRNTLFLNDQKEWIDVANKQQFNDNVLNHPMEFIDEVVESGFLDDFATEDLLINPEYSLGEYKQHLKNKKD